MWKWIFYLLFISLVVYPYSFYGFKIPIISIALIISTIKVFARQRVDMSKSTFLLFFNYIAIGILFILYGIVIGTSYKGSFPYVFALYVAFPIVYLFLLNVVPKEKSILVTIDKLFLFCSVAIFMVMYLAVLNKRGDLPEKLVFLVEAVKNVDLRTVKNVVKINFNGISSLVFLFPYLFAMFVLDRKPKKTKTRLVHLICLFLSGYAAFISGRRALIVILLLSMVITVLYKMGVHRIKLKVRTVRFLIVCLIVTLPFLNYGKIVNSINSTITFALNINYHKDSSISDNERINQASSFGLNIIKKPILGYGHGASMKEIQRSAKKPWRYELSYLDIIFHTGLVGFVFYALGPMWIIWSLRRVIKYDKEYGEKAFAVLLGFCAILLTYASNPYLNAFDIQWVIYFPILFINIVNRRKQEHISE